MVTIEGLAALAGEHRGALACRVKEFELRGRHFAFNSRPSIMGVINLSPDSWYRESVCLSAARAIERGRVLQAQGADVVDVGAESTLFEAARADEVLQNSRLLPVIRELSRHGVPISVETYHLEVARAALDAGACILNLTGTAQSEEIYRMVAAHEAAVIICYVQGANVREVGEFDFGKDPVGLMRDFFGRQIERATRNGVEKIFIDPGLGFYYRNLRDSAQRVRHQTQVFLNTFRLRELGYPTCHALPHAFEYFGEEVRSAESYFAVLAALGKTDLLRTHEVPRIRAVLETMRA